MRRILSVWFPEWPLDRLRRTRQEPRTGSPDTRPSAAVQPFVLTEAGPHGLEVAAANQAARNFGIAPGLRFTDACARVPGLASEEIDWAADHAALTTLGRWMTRWAPLTALDGRDGLVLDVTGAAHLFGGEAAMLADISARLTAGGIVHRQGLAGTLGAAWALAREGTEPILPEGGERTGLAGLPVTGLRLSDKTLRLLRRFGLTRIGQLYNIDRQALARRFRAREAADAVLLRRDQALGLREEPLIPLCPPPAYAARLPCPEPLGDIEGVGEGLGRLLGMLCADLAGHGQGARDFMLRAFRSDGTVVGASISVSRPTREAAHVLRLFRDRIETVDPGYGIDFLVLEAGRVGDVETSPSPLGPDLAVTPVDEAILAALADRITARLGAGAVSIVAPAESHVPERAERHMPFTGHLSDWPVRTAPCGPRPARIFVRPERVEVMSEVPDGPPLLFTWRRVSRRVIRAEGPERIAPEWWRATGTRPRARDYYRVEDEAGRRYWLFREGLYNDGRGGPPGWFLHGLFA